MLMSIPGILIGFTFHEFAHAYMATRYGDPTPGRQGRLTLNPIAHIDIWGFALILLAGFGWAKPVQTNPSYYRGSVRKKDLIVSMVGPLTNLAIAVVTAVIFVFVYRLGAFNAVSPAAETVIGMIEGVIWMNLVLFVFNLIPIPPLDGFHVLTDLLPSSYYRFIYTVEKYGYFILLAFIVLPISDWVIGGAAGFIYGKLMNILLLVF
jgi:Zn-dependent protease